MRIGIDCHFESKIQQGTNTYISELVAAIARNDKKNKYFLLNAEYDGSKYSKESHNIFKKPVRTNSTKKNILYGYRGIVKDIGLDILHTNYLAPFWTPCKKIVTIHDILYMSHKQFFPSLHRLQLKMLTPFALRFADKIISVSEYTRKEIIRRFGLDPKKICVTLEAASPDFMRLNDKDRELKGKGIKEKYGLGNEFLLYVGRFAPIKNIPRMLAVLSEYNKGAKSKISFALVGDHDPVYPDEELFPAINRAKKYINIVLLKNLPKTDLISLYNTAKALLFISHGEGFGLPILEAMACGLPVITSNVTSCPEIAGKAAILVDPYNEKQIFDALTSVLGSDTLRSRLAENGLRRAKLFCWDRCARETCEIYRELA